MATDLDKVRHHVEVLKLVKAKQSELKALEANARAAIEDAIGDDDAGTLDGHTVITWKSYKKRGLDQAALKKDHPEIVESYTVMKEQRTFKVLDEE